MHNNRLLVKFRGSKLCLTMALSYYGYLDDEVKFLMLTISKEASEFYLTERAHLLSFVKQRWLHCDQNTYSYFDGRHVSKRTNVKNSSDNR